MQAVEFVEIDGKLYRKIAETKWSVTLQNKDDKDDILIATKAALLIENKEKTHTIKDKENYGKKINIR